MELNFGLENIHDAAKRLMANAPGKKVFAFHGEMGAGKTTFIHALCKILGVKDAISSPTFSIINQYKGDNEQTIYHMDLYRLRDDEEAVSAGIEDCLYSGNVCLVEWPEKAPGIFPDGTLYITLTVLDSNTRKLQINL